MLRGGIPLVKALESLIRRDSHPAQQQILVRLLQGQCLSQAGTAHFTPLQLALIRVGENTGKLDDALLLLADYEEGRTQRRQQLQAQLAYPCLVFVVLLVMLEIGLPMLAQQLPWGGHGPLLWLPSLLVGVGLLLAFRLRGRWLAWIQRYPPWSELQRRWATLQFLTVWSSTLEAGIPLLTSLQLAREANTISPCRQALQRVTQGLKDGKDLGEAFAENGYFPQALTGTVEAGLECGRLPRLLKAVLALEEVAFSATLDGAIALLAPLMLLICGLVLLISLHQTLTPLLAQLMQLT